MDIDILVKQIQHRINCMSTKTREYLSPYIAEVLDNYYRVCKEKRGRVGAVVRDRIAYYIAANYGTSFLHVRNFVDVNKPFLNIIETFIDDHIDYTVIRDFAKRNSGDIYVMNHDLNTNPKDHLCYLIKPKNGPKFLQVTNEGIIEVDMEHSTTVDYFMSNHMTHTVVERLLKDNGYQNDFILVKCHHPHCHVQSEFKENSLNG